MITFEEQGEPNSYRLKDGPNHWFAIIQLNGELMPVRQKEIMERIVKALNEG